MNRAKDLYFSGLGISPNPKQHPCRTVLGQSSNLCDFLSHAEPDTCGADFRELLHSVRATGLQSLLRGRPARIVGNRFVDKTVSRAADGKQVPR